MGAYKRGLKPQIFRENRGEILPGKSGLFGADWGLSRNPGCIGAFRGRSDRFLRTAPHSHGEEQKLPRKGPFWPNWRLLFWISTTDNPPALKVVRRVHSVLWIFWPFFIGKIKEEKSHPKIHGKIQIGIWELRGQNPHCKEPALKNSIKQGVSDTPPPKFWRRNCTPEI